MTDKRPLHGLVSYDDDDDDNSQQKRKLTGLTGLVAYGGDDDDDDEIEETSEPLTKAIIHKVAVIIPTPSTISPHANQPFQILTYLLLPPIETTPRKSNAPVHLKPSTSLTNSPSLANLVRLRTAHAVSAPTSPSLRASSPLIPSRDRDTLSPFLADSPRVSDDGMEIDKALDDEDEEERKKKRMRELLKPKPIEGVEDWGLLPEPEGECDPELEVRFDTVWTHRNLSISTKRCLTNFSPSAPSQAKVAHFHTLRAAGTHFNTHLLRSKAFRNPHIYAKLVEFVDLDETGSNFPPEMFNPHGFPPQAFVTELVEAQRRMAEERAQQQTTGSRSNIHFVGATTAAVDSTSR
ncbi:HCNGP-like protein-domain-containing protein, partial [Endogone sp. FLAS-F59071]